MYCLRRLHSLHELKSSTDVLYKDMNYSLYIGDILVAHGILTRHRVGWGRAKVFLM